MSEAVEIPSLLSGHRRTLAKAITLIESLRSEDRSAAEELIEKILSKTGKSFRIGITGVPGVGKSTFIESFGALLLKDKKKLGVLTVDPSSPVSGGSILGDKTRMEKLVQSEEVFIRPAPSGGSLGGVAQRTRESVLLMEAAGFDCILIETVGVGQSEVEVAGMVDMFVVLLLPNAGDELQGIKKGIIELADIIVVNKSDGPNVKMAERAQKDYQAALQLLSREGESEWQTPVMTASGLEAKNLKEIWAKVQEFEKQQKKSRAFAKKRSAQNRKWTEKLVQEILLNNVKEKRSQQWDQLLKDVEEGTLSPVKAARNLTKS